MPLHDSNDAAPVRANEERGRWLALLAQAPLALLEDKLQPYQSRFEMQWLRSPETGLYMLEGRVGGAGERFNLGEVTVTRAVLRLNGVDPPPTVGVAYVLGRGHDQARLVAFADALLQRPAWRTRLERQLLAPIRSVLAERDEALAQAAQMTKVDFFSIAREAGQPTDDGAEK